jgi:hypothetical protein
MKTIKLTLLSLFFPLIFWGQSLTGLWVGTISNDSTTIRKDQSFEIVLTQYKDKVYGYSRTTFIVNDSLFYVVKRVLGTIDGDVCEVKDDEIVSYNFRARLDKGVKMISTFHLNRQDSSWHMDGEWKTNKTKKFYSVSGKMSLKEEKDLEKSKIIPHLEELKLTNDVAVYNEAKKASQSVAVVSPPVKDNKKEQPANNKEVKSSVASSKEIKTSTPSTTEPVVQTKQPANNNKKDSLSIAQTKPAPVKETNQPVNDPKKESVAVTKPVEQKKEAVQEPINKDIKKQETVSVDPVTKEKDKPVAITNNNETKPTPVIPVAAALVKERKIEPPQIVSFRSDSLELSLYDNGEVDGDTVSILLNGEVIWAKQGLKATAIKKTIYAPSGTNDSMMLVLYAENLGK